MSCYVKHSKGIAKFGNVKHRILTIKLEVEMMSRKMVKELRRVGLWQVLDTYPREHLRRVARACRVRTGRDKVDTIRNFCKAVFDDKVVTAEVDVRIRRTSIVDLEKDLFKDQRKRKRKF